MEAEYALFLEEHLSNLSSETETDPSITEDVVSDNPDIKDEEDLRKQLQDLLDNLQLDGTFSSLYTTSQFVNPGLHINTIGSIALPLSSRDALTIIGRCRKAPFGRKDETVIDENVRRTWELDAAEFQCLNPAWESYLQRLLKNAVTNLGVQGTTSCYPYKLLFYEEGAFFKAHRGTEKVPGMFGTLVVCLPSEHTGGQVLLKHGRKEQTLETAGLSSFDLSVLAWYSDVQHEIKPVTSRYRLVWTYNLVQDQEQPKQTAAALDSSHARLKSLLTT
ncbi:hypothetical protein BDW02DRAFT_495568 [Decorospora gaudefroyi]|uniref:Prolyl 4-hydroxylase alpha subunit Fe(2+) 2OG dioxygenase domain-containing protein n=1 Tax=Decorospora gaudefroyi TaxID=184978 RepID=A0A6A5KC61_9PLEO|nr:hypothetical protein BDW02DRAFT_495568 [Decorospora gaudefroyi]